MRSTSIGLHMFHSVCNLLQSITYSLKTNIQSLICKLKHDNLLFLLIYLICSSRILFLFKYYERGIMDLSNTKTVNTMRFQLYTFNYIIPQLQFAYFDKSDTKSLFYTIAML